ncbi:MAG: GNAT family N-acetyltransferase [Rubrobacter sp.]
MAFYAGPDYEHEGVRIGQPAAGMAGKTRWFAEARRREDVCLFPVYAGGALVGEIFLHDQDEGSGESLVGYHIFEPALRGRGTGTKALTLLKRFVAERTGLRRLVIITSRDNRASQALARRCGFTHTGAPREDPENGMVFEWLVQAGPG